MNIHPEPSVIRLVCRIGLNLRLDPLHGTLVIVYIRRVRIRQTRRPIPMTSKPPIVPVVSLAVPASSDICIDIRAMKPVS